MSRTILSTYTAVPVLSLKEFVTPSRGARSPALVISPSCCHVPYILIINKRVILFLILHFS